MLSNVTRTRTDALSVLPSVAAVEVSPPDHRCWWDFESTQSLYLTISAKYFPGSPGEHSHHGGSTRTHGHTRTRQHVKAEYRWKYMLFSWWSTYTTGAEFLSVLYELKSTAMWWCSWRLSVVDGSNPGGRRANHCTMEPHVHLFEFCELQFWLYISDLFKTQKVSLHSGKYDVNWMMSFLTSVFQTYHSAVVGLNTELLCLL